MNYILEKDCVNKENHSLLIKKKYNYKLSTTSKGVLRISLYDAQAWLREQYGIYVYPYYEDDTWYPGITDMYGQYNSDSYTCYNICTDNNSYTSFEEAFNKAIREALDWI